MTPRDAEIAANPRARSAKLRAAVRTDGAGAAGRHVDVRTSRSLPDVVSAGGEVSSVFRTSDIVLIAVMVSAAAFTYKTKHEAEDQLGDGPQDRGADQLRAGHDRPAQGRLEPADPAVAPAEAGRDLPGRARSSQPVEAQPDRRHRRPAGRSRVDIQDLSNAAAGRHGRQRPRTTIVTGSGGAMNALAGASWLRQVRQPRRAAQRRPTSSSTARARRPAARPGTASS